MASVFSLRLRDVAAMPVRHPVTGKPLLMSDGRAQAILLCAVDSAPYRKALAKAMGEWTGQLPVVPEELPQLALSLVSACVAGWTLEDADGSDYPFTGEDCARELFADEGLAWLLQQCDRFIADRAKFLGEG